MLDVMLDLETMGTGPNAAIVAIGAVNSTYRPKRLESGFIGLPTLNHLLSAEA